MSNLFDIKRKQLFNLKKLRDKKILGGVQEETKDEEVLMVQCPSCKNEYSKVFMRRNLNVCPNCGFHMTISARERINQIIDKGSFKEQNSSLVTGNPLKFPTYRNKIKVIQEQSGEKDAIITGRGTVNGQDTEIAVLDSTFMMGSMGTVVGEKFTLAVEYAMKNNLPFICVSASGGARMQEGMFSLMQMAKTSAVVEKFQSKGGFFLSILTHPTMGGVSASFAMLGDIIYAEPEALIGFAGPRVIEQTINQKLPKGFQRAEFQEEHGFVDKIVSRKELKETIGKTLYLHKKDR
jgi:acetyl-CoA carboxylase carboxyl transferase subunit beta